MLELAIKLRASQLYLHHAHLLAKGSLFIQDHAFLGELYNEMEAEFDSVCERMIGLGKEQELALQPMLVKVYECLKSYPSMVKENKDYFIHQLQIEGQIKQLCQAICNSEGVSEGTKQMVGDIANRSEIRCYKLSRRIK